MCLQTTCSPTNLLNIHPQQSGRGKGKQQQGVEDAILYLLHKAHSHLDKGSGAVRIMFFDFSSTFNTIQPILLRDKLSGMGVDAHLVTWIADYLTERPQFVTLHFRHRVLQQMGAARDSALPCPVHTIHLTSRKSQSSATYRNTLTTLQMLAVLQMDKRRSTGAWWRTLWDGAG